MPATLPARNTIDHADKQSVATLLTPSRLLSLAEAAERVGVSTATLRRRVHDGTLPAVRLGPSDRYPIRIDAGELDAWIYRSGELPSGSPIPVSAAAPEALGQSMPSPHAGHEGES